MHGQATRTERPGRASRRRRRPGLPGHHRPGRGRPVAVVCVFNPKAANADLARLKTALSETFGRRGLHYSVLTVGPEGAAGITHLVEQAIREGCRLVLAAGGDGTVSCVGNTVSQFHHREPPVRLGIVPLGTANVLARELGLPLDIETAVAVIAEERRIVAVDALELDGRRYFTQIGVGLDAKMIATTSREAQNRWKRLAYLISLVRGLAGHRSRRFRIEADARGLWARAWQVLLANARTLGAPPFTWGPHIRPSDGVAEVCIVHAGGWRDALALIGTALRGRHRADPRVRYLQVRHQATIATATPLPVQADGEIVAHTPVTVRVVSAALQVVVPESRGQIVHEDRTGEPAIRVESPSAPAATPPPRRARVRAATHALSRVATIGALDAALFLRLNALEAGARIDRTLRGACRLLDHGEVWIGLAALASLLDPTHHRRLAFEVLPALWLTMVTVNFGIKRLFRRARPFATYVDARVIGRRPADWSFPSGHAAAAFAGATLLSSALPGLAPLFFAYAFVVAFARVYLGVHYPSDVLIGAGAGITLAALLGTVMRAVLPAA